jgi:hypothetical protein
MKIRILVVAGTLALLAASAVYAQTLSVDVPFGFTAAGTQFPSGHYQFTPASGNRSVRIDGPENHKAIAQVLTRLAGAIHTTPKDAHVVFDKVETQYFLSEIWIPQQDGYDMYNTKAKHEHKVIDVPVQ